MATTAPSSTSVRVDDGATTSPPRGRLLGAAPAIARWLPELLVLLLLYLAYAEVRDRHGEGTEGHADLAHANGVAIAQLEHRWHLGFEQAVQSPVLPHPDLMRLLNGWYGGAHFAVTLFALCVLVVRGGPDYRRWRSVLVLSTAVAVCVFALYPTMPPRLLPPPYGTVDSLRVFGGLWTYNGGSLEKIADPFAAMPSLHLVWAGWCGAVGWTVLKRPLLRALAVLYPCVTTYVVIATGNHFVLDTVAGLLVLAIGWAAVVYPARLLDALRRRQRQATTPT